MIDRDVHLGLPVEMTSSRWRGRTGVVEKMVILNAGYRWTHAWRVKLTATKRAQARIIACFASSFEVAP
jgi:hypothetical protein